MARVVKKREDDFALYIDQPGLWEFLSEPEAEQLITERGLLPVDLLYGEKRYPPEVHARIRELLKKGDEPIAEMLLLCRGEPAFLPFLRRDLPLDVLRGLSEDLFQHKMTLRTRLETLQRKLNDSVDRLREEVGVKPPGAKEYLPFYSIYKVYQDYADGEDTSTLDLAFAAADLASVAVPAAKGLIVFKGAAKVAAKGRVKDLIKNQAATVVKGKSRTELAARFGHIAVNKYSVRLAAEHFLTEAVRAIQRVLTHGIKVKARVDVTGLLRFVNQRLGRDPFRKLTGLNPVVFLHSDGRVYLELVWSKGVIMKHQRALLALRKFVERWKDDGLSDAAEAASLRPGEPKGRTPKLETQRSGPRSAVHPSQAGVLWLMALADLLPEEPR